MGRKSVQLKTAGRSKKTRTNVTSMRSSIIGVYYENLAIWCVCVCGGGVNGLKGQFLYKMNVVVDSFIYSMY